VTPSFELPSERATRALAEKLAPLLRGGDLVILSGALGAGKTFLARALCAALGVEPRRVTSPTFSLVHEFEGELPIAHADLYRLRTSSELRELGLDALRDDGRLLLVEWGEPYAAELGGDALSASFTLEPRRVAFAASGARSEALRNALVEIAQKLDVGAGAR
jgi:tRNA threonylcarbamoyladenosine biosynthesis protein TsaE